MKKAKVDGGMGKQTKGRANGTANTRAKARAQYEEEHDGFQFSRTRSKKAQAKATTPLEPLASSSSPKPAAAAKRKKTPSMAFGTEAEKKPRRSARLSGGKQPVEPEPATQPQTNGVDKPTHGQENVRDEGVLPVEREQLRIDTTRETSETQKISLPFADTPIIKRNKEMRQGKRDSGGHRRSSAGMRGRRASSLLDSGASNGTEQQFPGSYASSAVSSRQGLHVDLDEDGKADLNDVRNDLALPHNEVETSEFYKHISQDMLEPKRMQTLLVWCAARAMSDQPAKEGKDTSAVLAGAFGKAMFDSDGWTDSRAARVIQEELQKAVATKSEMSNWFNRVRTNLARPAEALTDPWPAGRHGSDHTNEEAQSSKHTKCSEAQRTGARGAKVGLAVVPRYLSLVSQTDFHGNSRLQEEERSWKQLLKESTTPSATRSVSNQHQSLQPQPAASSSLTGQTSGSLDDLTTQKPINPALLDPSQLPCLAILSNPPAHKASQSTPQDSPAQGRHPGEQQANPADSIPPSTDPAQLNARLRTVASTLERSVDAFADGIHGLGSFRTQAERVADVLLARAAQALEERSEGRPTAAGEAGDDEQGPLPPNLRHVLRGLSRVIGR